MGVLTRPILFRTIKSHHQSVYLLSTFNQFNTSSQIFLLNSNDIYRNLTFEECLYREGEKYLQCVKDKPPWFSKILLWRSNPPCIVIGRFQNVWNEVNCPLVHSKGWKLARRHSGGGTVYHDLGNLNITFMQPRCYMNRQECMALLQSILQPLLMPLRYTIHIGSRYDLWITENQTSTNLLENQFKISGSSSKFGANMAYHHCTLLFDANLNNLSEVLKPTFINLQTKATDSVRSPVKNINLNIDLLLNAIIEQSLKWIAKYDLITSHPKVTHVIENQEQQFITDQKQFHQLFTTLQTWSWIYGSSPSFSIPIENYNINLYNIIHPLDGSILLNFDRGALFKSIEFHHRDGTTVQNHHHHQFLDTLNEFLTEITICLRHVECRTNSWDFILDQWIAKKSFQLNGENLPEEQLLIIKVLTLISSLF
ncbi:unnamed protein product [Schistosoma turkestanicum]|nr:unnamed protein product [Schistosoma turkestanicum]